MTGIEVVKAIKEKKGITNTALAKALGYAGPSGVRERLARTGEGNVRDMTVDILVKYLDALGYEVCVREKGKSRAEYVIGRAEE